LKTAANNMGNDKALEVLFSGIFRQHEFRLYLLALKLTKSEHIAKDIIQEVFLKLWEQRKFIGNIVNMEAWLYRLTENKVIDFLRKTAADSKLKNIVWNNLQESKDEAEEYFQVREYNEIIQKAINELPPQRKLIYQLNREGGLNYQQIADELQLSRHTVKNQLFTAVQSIRKYISRNVKLFSTFF